MSTGLVIILGLVAWTVLSFGLGLFLGAVFRLGQDPPRSEDE